MLILYTVHLAGVDDLRGYQGKISSLGGMGLTKLLFSSLLQKGPQGLSVPFTRIRSCTTLKKVAWHFTVYTATSHLSARYFKNLPKYC